MYTYNKFSKDYKNKYISLNSWKAIGETSGFDTPEAERRFKNCRTSYGRDLKKRNSIPSSSRHKAVPTAAEFANLEWLNSVVLALRNCIVSETNVYLIVQHQDHHIAKFLPEVKFSIAQSKLLHKRMVCSKLFAFFKYFTNPKSTFPSCFSFPS